MLRRREQPRPEDNRQQPLQLPSSSCSSYSERPAGQRETECLHHREERQKETHLPSAMVRRRGIRRPDRVLTAHPLRNAPLRPPAKNGIAPLEF